MPKRILITGGAGFIGSHLAESLLANPALEQLYVLDNLNDYYSPEQKKANLKILENHPQAPRKLHFLEDDIRTTTAIKDYHPELVIHLASMAGVRFSLQKPAYYAEVNILGQINLLEQVRTLQPPPKFIYASSSSVYGLNTKVPFSEEDSIELQNSSYACSKLAMEIYANYYARLYGLEVVGLRFFTVYGPRGRPDMAPFKFLKAIHQGQSLTKFGTGETYRDYTYISDIIQGIQGVIQRLFDQGRSEAGKPKQVYNLGNHTPVSLNEFIATCEEVVGRSALIEQLPPQPGDVPRTYADVQRAQTDLDFQPKVLLKEGLTNLYQWMLKNYLEESDSD